MNSNCENLHTGKVQIRVIRWSGQLWKLTHRQGSNTCDSVIWSTVKTYTPARFKYVWFGDLVHCENLHTGKVQIRVIRWSSPLWKLTHRQGSNTCDSVIWSTVKTYTPARFMNTCDSVIWSIVKTYTSARFKYVWFGDLVHCENLHIGKVQIRVIRWSGPLRKLTHRQGSNTCDSVIWSTVNTYTWATYEW